MYSTNQILFRLYHANKLFESGTPQEIELGVIILDNTIEGWLYQAGNHVLQMDYVDYYRAPREYSKQYRSEYDRRFDKLISHAIKTNLIDEPAAEILKYAHGIRNDIYHKFESNHKNTEIAKRIYIHVLHRYAAKWPHPGLFFTHSTEIGYEVYDWTTKTKKDISAFRGSGIGDNWKIAFTQLDDEQALSDLISKFIHERAYTIHSSLKDIRQCIKEKLQWEVFARYAYLTGEFDIFKRKSQRMPTIDYVLLAHEFIRKYRDILEDENTSASRRKLGKKLFQKVRKGKGGHYQHLKAFLSKPLVSFEKRYASASKAIAALNRFNSNFGDLERDSLEASYDYHRHIEDLYESYKGK